MNEVSIAIIALFAMFFGVAAIWMALEASDAHRTGAQIPMAIILGIVFAVVMTATAFIVHWLACLG